MNSSAAALLGAHVCAIAKALLQALVEEIRVVSRAEIYPLFFCPRFDHR